MNTIHDIYRANLRLLVEECGSQSALADRLDKPAAQISQWLSDSPSGRNLSPKTARLIEGCLGKPLGWMDQVHESRFSGVAPAPPRIQPHVGMSVAYYLPPDDFVQVRQSTLRLSATLTGWAVDFLDDEDAPPLWFRRDWLQKRGWRADKLLALGVQGASMEPGLRSGDTVLVNTAQTEPRDGHVFAINYEGQPVIKRMVRDAGQWWLSSDNPNQALFPRKIYDEHSSIVGEVVHKQSDEI